MFFMSTAIAIAAKLADQPPGCADGDLSPSLCDPARVKVRQLQELERLRETGMETARRISDWLDGGMDDGEARILAGRTGMITQFVRTTRAIRQIMVLEQELVGLRPAPDRDAPPEPREAAQGERHGDGLALRENLHDYDNGPLDQVVARIRRALNVEPPEHDPFAPVVMRLPNDAPNPAPTGDEAGICATSPLAEPGQVAAEAEAAAPTCVSQPAPMQSDAISAHGIFAEPVAPPAGGRGRDPPL
jgi:hypothetical protein